MRLVAVTATYERPECLTLCREWMRRQTRPPDEHVIVEGGHIWDNLLAADIGDADAVAFIEDDDYYAPQWLEWVERSLGNADICGALTEIRYHIPGGMMTQWERKREHGALLCMTGIRAEHWGIVQDICRREDYRIDRFLWPAMEQHRKALEPVPYVITMKGIPAPRKYNRYHRGDLFATIKEGVTMDPDRSILRSLVGAEVCNLYARWFGQEQPFERYTSGRRR